MAAAAEKEMIFFNVQVVNQCCSGAFNSAPLEIKTAATTTTKRLFLIP